MSTAMLHIHTQIRLLLLVFQRVLPCSSVSHVVTEFVLEHKHNYMLKKSSAKSRIKQVSVHVTFIPFVSYLLAIKYARQ